MTPLEWSLLAVAHLCFGQAGAEAHRESTGKKLGGWWRTGIVLGWPVLGAVWITRQVRDMLRARRGD